MMRMRNGSFFETDLLFFFLRRPFLATFPFIFFPSSHFSILFLFPFSFFPFPSFFWGLFLVFCPAAEGGNFFRGFFVVGFFGRILVMENFFCDTPTTHTHTYISLTSILSLFLGLMCLCRLWDARERDSERERGRRMTPGGPRFQKLSSETIFRVR